MNNISPANIAKWNCQVSHFWLGLPCTGVKRRPGDPTRSLLREPRGAGGGEGGHKHQTSDLSRLLLSGPTTLPRGQAVAGKETSLCP